MMTSCDSLKKFKLITLFFTPKTHLAMIFMSNFSTKLNLSYYIIDINFGSFSLVRKCFLIHFDFFIKFDGNAK